ncbi:DUF3786 domain-containing protein [Desulfosoma caldarium]|uniref:Putative signal transducing protein n=1 Tax=Desulfosoma caldarium TaxID=610254 RepID=A0A3N1VT58_9BACT|nr:DUF3786 domain-containing protein [Desulfosoma caldarium]ROR03017.1 putative signal transducing protein [Desulfosoma caldarium]
MESPSASPWVFLYTLANRFEADVLSDVLEKNGVPYLVRSFVETAYDGLFVPQRGWGQILVPAEFLSTARKLVASVLESLTSPKLYESVEELDPSLWDQLARRDPQNVCRRAAVTWNAAHQSYRIPFLAGAFTCVPAQKTILPEQGLVWPMVDFQTGLVLLHYLLEAQDLPLSGRWISEKDIPSGHQFFTGPHALPLDALVRHVADAPHRLAETSKALGGVPVPSADMGFVFVVLPRVPVQCLYWHGDGEFPPSLSIRFDATIAKHLPALDTIWALVNVFVRHWTAALKQA